MTRIPFIECDRCDRKLGSPTLCDRCLRQRYHIGVAEQKLRRRRWQNFWERVGHGVLGGGVGVLAIKLNGVERMLFVAPGLVCLGIFIVVLATLLGDNP